MQKPQIILASASIGRKGLLEKLKVPFKVLPSTIDEDLINDKDPITRLSNRARAKAEDVLKQLERSKDDYLIIAADSEALLNGKTYGKSKNKAHSKQIITALMGRTHDFLTATSIIHLKNGKEANRWEDITKTYVTLRKMSETELASYINQYDFTRFAAAYTLNETPWDLITKIEGSYTSVIGLPFEVVLPIFRKVKLLFSL